MDRGVKPWGVNGRTRLSPIEFEGNPGNPNQDSIMSSRDTSPVRMQKNTSKARQKAKKAGAPPQTAGKLSKEDSLPSAPPQALGTIVSRGGDSSDKARMETPVV